MKQFKRIVLLLIFSTFLQEAVSMNGDLENGDLNFMFVLAAEQNGYVGFGAEDLEAQRNNNVEPQTFKDKIKDAAKKTGINMARYSSEFFLSIVTSNFSTAEEISSMAFHEESNCKKALRIVKLLLPCACGCLGSCIGGSIECIKCSYCLCTLSTPLYCCFEFMGKKIARHCC